MGQRKRALSANNEAALGQGLRIARNNGNGLAEPLSYGEWEVLRLLAHGLTNPVIAARLKVSLGKVKYSREQIMIKLKLQGTAKLTQYAIAHGLVPLSRGSSFEE